jgi:hypothetical protein
MAVDIILSEEVLYMQHRQAQVEILNVVAVIGTFCHKEIGNSVLFDPRSVTAYQSSECAYACNNEWETLGKTLANLASAHPLLVWALRRFGVDSLVVGLVFWMRGRTHSLVITRIQVAATRGPRECWGSRWRPTQAEVL